jgi:hypothetical protein
MRERVDIMREWLTPEVRKTIYSVVAAVSGGLVIYGLVAGLITTGQITVGLETGERIVGMLVSILAAMNVNTND